MNIIEELYFDNVRPQNSSSKTDAKIGELINIISENETELIKRLEGETKHLFLQNDI